MLKNIKAQGIGPIDSFEIELKERLNIITGDNGLGKSFILDIAWWILTRKWPAELNSELSQGLKIMPKNHSEPSINGSFDGLINKQNTGLISIFNKETQSWSIPKGKPKNPGLVLYAMSDGSFAVWDPARNYWNRSEEEEQRLPAYVFTPIEVMKGLKVNNKLVCKGLIADLVDWETREQDVFEKFKQVLKVLSPSDSELLEMGKTLNDLNPLEPGYIPTIKYITGEEIPVDYTSSAIKRVLKIAYLTVWAWHYNEVHSKKFGEKPAHQLTLLIDEPEVHLHPKWQRTILSSLLELMKLLAPDKNSVQIVTTTHSPSILASVEEFYDDKIDAWFDIDFNPTTKTVELEEMSFVKKGRTSSWLTSDAFDLKTDYNKQTEEVYLEAENFILNLGKFSLDKLEKLKNDVINNFAETDPFVYRFMAFYNQEIKSKNA